MSLVIIHATRPSHQFQAPLKSSRGCNRRGSGVENSAFNSPVPPATTHAQVRQHTVAGACSFPSPVPVLHAVTPRKDSPTSSLSPSCKSTRKYNTNGNHSKGSFDAHVKAAGASASYLTTPSTASPSTDVSGHTTSSTGRSSVNSSGNEALLTQTSDMISVYSSITGPCILKKLLEILSIITIMVVVMVIVMGSVVIGVGHKLQCKCK